jgi:protein-tyrosine phosphatase
MYTDIYWIENFTLGKLGTMSRPRGGDWLVDEVSNWKRCGVDVVVSGLNTLEMRELDIVNEPEYCEKTGIDFFQYPIEDRGIPESSKDWIAFIHKVNNEFQKGKNIVTHCRMGIGRATLIAVSLMILNGIEPSLAFEWVEQARGFKVPDTEEQREWIAQLKFEMPEIPHTE